MKLDEMRKLAQMVSKAEGKKSEVKIGDIMEILRILGEINSSTGGAVAKLFGAVLLSYKRKSKARSKK